MGPAIFPNILAEAFRYQPLDTARNEIRLLDRVWTRESGDPVADIDIPQFTIDHVSLDDFTPASQEYLISTGLQRFSGIDYENRICARSRAWNEGIQSGDGPLRQRSENFQKAVEAEIVADTDSKRWTWGDFKALSYTWGDLSATRSILVNGCVVQVTENLFDFLKEWTNEPAPQGYTAWKLWIDALCINQQDVEERNAQVMRMGDIYDQASNVVIWLGKGTDHVAKAMELLNTLFFCSLDTKDEQLKIRKRLREDPNMFEPGTWVGLYHLLSQPYWRRMWVIQEITISRSVMTICCGEHDMDWRSLHGAVLFLASEPLTWIEKYQLDCKKLGMQELLVEGYGLEICEFYSRIGLLGRLPDVLKLDYREQKLCDLLRLVRDSRQHDERDKVYGVLGLIEPAIANLITPDYNFPVAKVYIDFAKAIITATESLYFIGASNRDLFDLKGLPSWVPDLRLRGVFDGDMMGGMAWNPFHASGDSQIDVMFEDMCLSARGFQVDVVDGLGAVFNAVDGTLDRAGQPQLSQTQACSPYPDDATVRDALWRTFVANREEHGLIAPEAFACLLNISKNSFDQLDPPLNSDFLSSYSNYLGYITCAEHLWISDRRFLDWFTRNQLELDLSPESVIFKALRRAVDVMGNRRFMVTTNGYFGSAPETTRQGDIICVLLGSSVPVALRKCVGGRYRVVGNCYVHGIMEGEATTWLETKECTLQTFDII